MGGWFIIALLTLQMVIEAAKLGGVKSPADPTA